MPPVKVFDVMLLFEEPFCRIAETGEKSVVVPVAEDNRRVDRATRQR